MLAVEFMLNEEKVIVGVNYGIDQLDATQVSLSKISLLALFAIVC